MARRNQSGTQCRDQTDARARAQAIIAQARELEAQVQNAQRNASEETMHHYPHPIYRPFPDRGCGGTIEEAELMMHLERIESLLTNQATLLADILTAINQLSAATLAAQLTTKA